MVGVLLGWANDARISENDGGIMWRGWGAAIIPRRLTAGQRSVPMENLVLLPGMMCDERLWGPQIDGLRGQCRSITVGDISRSDSIESLARDVLEAAPPRFALAGLSMGGIVALEMWRLSASGGEIDASGGKQQTRITRLALLNTNAHADLPERSRQRDELLARALAGGFEDMVKEELKPVYLAEKNKDNGVLLDTVFAMAMMQGTEVFQRQCRALQSRAGFEAVLPSINVPTLLLCGDEDRLCPVAVHRQMAEAIPDSQLHIIESCGHLSTMEAPEEVNRALGRWLQI